jgi:GT2 family glycosyltransferase
MPKISVIIVTYKGFKWYSKCFGSLLASTVPLDIIVVDNNSNDGTVDFIKEKFPSIFVIQNKENIGFAKANNQALDLAYNRGSDFFFLLNQDAWVEPDTIEILLKYANNNELFGILAPVQLNGEKTQFDYAFKEYYLNQINMKNLCENLFLKKDYLYEVSFVNAAAWLVSRKCYEKIGDFDTILFTHYGEDDNYCQRVLFHKLKVGIVFETCFYHDRTAELIKFNANKASRKYVGAAIFYGNINLSVVNIIYKLIRNFVGSILRLSPMEFFEKILFICENFRSVKISRRRNCHSKITAGDADREGNQLEKR